MKKNEKILILVLITILAIVIIVKINQGGREKEENNVTEENEVIEEYVQVLEDGTKLNTSEELSETKELGNLEFTNIQLTNQNGQTVLLADVRNKGSIATDVTLVEIRILDKAGNELGKVGGIVSPLEVGEMEQFNTVMTRDYANAYNFEINVK